jgi:ribA/ribD-fused uncharacterized protein
MSILSFNGKNYFLSNFFMAPVSYKGFTFTNSEAAFQAQKCYNPSEICDFLLLTPGEAKYRGRGVVIRPDWDEVREGIMYDICKAKFEQNPELKAMLLATGDEYLEEGNTWGDITWGTVNGIGKNWLGLILMRLRLEFK